METKNKKVFRGEFFNLQMIVNMYLNSYRVTERRKAAHVVQEAKIMILSLVKSNLKEKTIKQFTNEYWCK